MGCLKLPHQKTDSRLNVVYQKAAQNRHKKVFPDGTRFYRYGFNGMERDDEVKGKGNSYDFGARMQDPRLGGRFFSVDPMSYAFPWSSPYSFAGNSPIWAFDYQGLYPIKGTIRLDDGTTIHYKFDTDNTQDFKFKVSGDKWQSFNFLTEDTERVAFHNKAFPNAAHELNSLGLLVSRTSHQIDNSSADVMKMNREYRGYLIRDLLMLAIEAEGNISLTIIGNHSITRQTFINPDGSETTQEDADDEFQRNFTLNRALTVRSHFFNNNNNVNALSRWDISPEATHFHDIPIQFRRQDPVGITIALDFNKHKQQRQRERNRRKNDGGGAKSKNPRFL